MRRRRGEEIPWGARLIAVVDAYTAMMEDRPYQPAHSQAWALAELHRCAGSQFDPLLVEAVARVLGAGQLQSKGVEAA